MSDLTYISHWSRQKYNSIKDEIFMLLGMNCTRCGIDDKRVLCIDHVNGGGYKEISKGAGLTYYKKILSKIKTGSEEYQLLCHNCNWIKRFENNEVRRGDKQKVGITGCKCGCGMLINKYDRRNRLKAGYVSGHNSKSKMLDAYESGSNAIKEIYKINI